MLALALRSAPLSCEAIVGSTEHEIFTIQLQRLGGRRNHFQQAYFTHGMWLRLSLEFSDS